MADKPVPRTLTLNIEETDKATVVKCCGHLTSGLTDGFHARIRPMVSYKKRIVLDLSEVVRMDSMGLGTLVALYTSAKGAGCELQLYKVGDRVKELLGLTNLWDVFVVIGERGIKM